MADDPTAQLDPAWLAAISEWARRSPLIVRVLVFGSRVKGTASPASDLDIAVEILPEPRDGADQETWTQFTWMYHSAEWEHELTALLPVRPDLECVNLSPRLMTDILGATITVFER